MHHHETQEALDIREAWNMRHAIMAGTEFPTGEADSKPSRMELPTPAGTVMLSLGDLAAGRSADGMLPASMTGEAPTRLSFTSLCT